MRTPETCNGCNKTMAWCQCARIAFEAARERMQFAIAEMEAKRYESPAVADKAWRAYCAANDEARAAFEALS